MDILEHWEAVTAVVAILAALAGFFARNWFINVNKALSHNREDLSRLEGRVGEMSHDAEDIKKDIRGHVEREETLLWPKVDLLGSQLTAMDSRLVRIEANLPNGELKTLLVRFDAMEKMFKATVENIGAHLREVAAEQKSHNLEAEDWKRRIVKLEG